MDRIGALRTLFRAAAVTALVPLLATSFVGVARGEEPIPEVARPAGEIFPLSAVRPGMRGYGLTVTSATHIERFEVEVLDVMKNYLPKQDVILVRCLGEAFADHRIAQGMSGSPIYFEDKVAGALSYTWSWARHALGGVTPIEAMLAEGKRPLDGRPAGAEPPTPLRGERAASAPAPAAADGRSLVPIATPLCLGGFSARGRADAERTLSSLGMFLEAGGSEAGGQPGRWANLDAPMAPGATLMVDLLRGDLSASALGTCTYVDGDTVYGFGHPFNELGETRLPMSVGYVYTVVSSTQISFKVGSSIRQVGAIRQDRNSCVVGRLGEDAPMVPVDVHFRNAVTKRAEDLHFEVAANRVFFQPILLMALREAFGKAEMTLGPNTKRFTLTVKIAGVEKPWSYTDVVAGFDAGLSRVLIGLVDRVMIHPSQRADFERLDLDVEIDRVDRRATIENVEASKDEVRPGEEVDLRVRLRSREGGNVSHETLRMRVPADAPDGAFTVQVMTGDSVPSDVGTPVDLADIPALYAGFYRGTEIVAVVPTGRVDLDMDGRLVRNLPLSSIPRLVRSFEGPSAGVRPVTEKVRKDVPFVVEGSEKVSLEVRRDVVSSETPK